MSWKSFLSYILLLLSLVVTFMMATGIYVGVVHNLAMAWMLLVISVLGGPFFLCIVLYSDAWPTLKEYLILLGFWVAVIVGLSLLAKLVELLTLV